MHSVERNQNIARRPRGPVRMALVMLEACLIFGALEQCSNNPSHDRDNIIPIESESNTNYHGPYPEFNRDNLVPDNFPGNNLNEWVGDANKCIVTPAHILAKDGSGNFIVQEVRGGDRGTTCDTGYVIHGNQLSNNLAQEMNKSAEDYEEILKQIPPIVADSKGVTINASSGRKVGRIGRLLDGNIELHDGKLDREWGLGRCIVAINDRLEVAGSLGELEVAVYLGPNSGNSVYCDKDDLLVMKRTS